MWKINPEIIVCDIQDERLKCDRIGVMLVQGIMEI